MTTIKLLTNAVINNQIAGPKDKNNGIYAVSDAEARNLIARRRAVKFDGKIDGADNTKGNKTPSGDIEELKNLAKELGIKFNPNIGYEKLEVKVKEELDAKAEQIGLTFAQNLAVKDAYELYKTKAQDEEGEEITADELKEIAQAAKIEIGETTDEDLQEFIETELEQYAEELGLEVEENDDVKTIWAKIQEKLKNG